jgi:hypothetical protein
MRVSTYKEMLQTGYESAVANAEGCGEYNLSKLKFLADDLFEFSTYENDIATTMARKAVEVCQAISDKNTFDYITTDEGNFWYLIMVNMPFFQDKVDWGTSIRGAWWATYHNLHLKINGCAFTGEFELSFKDEESWLDFMSALIEFATEQPS